MYLEKGPVAVAQVLYVSPKTCTFYNEFIRINKFDRKNVCSLQKKCLLVRKKCVPMYQSVDRSS